MLRLLLVLLIGLKPLIHAQIKLSRISLERGIRHTHCGSGFLVDDTVIQRILRHGNVGVTRQSYIKIEDKVKSAAMKKLEGSLRAKIKARKKK